MNGEVGFWVLVVSWAEVLFTTFEHLYSPSIGQDVLAYYGKGRGLDFESYLYLLL